METAPSVSCLPHNAKMSKAKKVLEDAKEIENPELDLFDKGVSTFEEMPGLLNMTYITRLTLSHNKIKCKLYIFRLTEIHLLKYIHLFVAVPPGLANLVNLEILNLANNHVEDLPLSLSSMPRLRILNLSINRLYELPRGFGAFPALEILDLTYNNLKDDSLPGNFFMMQTLRALYLGDNDFEKLPADIRNLKNLEILVLRENDIIELPKELGELSRLRELHVQGNRLTILPPELGNLDMLSNKAAFKFEGNEWVPPIADQLKLGLSHLQDYLRSEAYRVAYNRYQTNKPSVPPPCADKAKKISRIR
ncbi:ras suppressor protein 1 isoform X1 [Rhynchophorus ferrugineus]|uniref:ras suppressor protein 1 isoform X1 n=1 Tax=Rhynchophorus ferrugineus TaxID=354439 RepID=UPI003FCDE712